MKIHLVGVELCSADRQTDRQTGRRAERHDEVNSLFHNFTNALENQSVNAV